MDDDAILAEQIEYYRARAEEYDEWWERVGMYDRGADLRAEWSAAVDQLESYVRDRIKGGDVLELAAGTGNLTRVLAAQADRVTAVDASRETLEINRAKLERAGLEKCADLVVGDVFAWRPPRRFDVVFFSFWISHVPQSAAQHFWSIVDAALKPGGLVVLADNLAPWDSSAAGTAGPGTSERTLNDGSKWTVVKRYWIPPDELRVELARYGWSFEVGALGDTFIVASGRRSTDG